MLRPARPDEAALLTDLVLRSKAMWGYDDRFLAAVRDELVITPDACATGSIQVAQDGERIAGLAEVEVDGDTAELAKLFVAPDAMRSGIGRLLFDWAESTARDAGARAMLIDSDPGAAEFYRRMGAVDDGEVPSGSIPGRMLPRLKLEL